MIEELKIVGIREKLTGGSTMPLVVEVEDQSGEILPYVLKLYKKDYVEEHFTVAKEIIISEIAKEFDLPVPNYGIIKFDHDLLQDNYSDSFIKKLHSGYKFCNEFKEGYLLFNPLINNGFLNGYEIENVFAFDNLIMNFDRGGFRQKPNLLINDEDYLLIDHEQTFPFLNSQHNTIDAQKIFTNYYFAKHIFYSKLKKKRNKAELFNEFAETLKRINLSFIDGLYEDFEKYDIDCGEKNTIFAYLNWCKNNPEYIYKILNNRIQ